MSVKVIGENLNIMSGKVRDALRRKDGDVIAGIAAAEAEAGVDFIDINLGPAAKEGAELMEWAVKAVRTVSDLPLCLDTTNIAAMEAGLRACGGEALINSISVRPERMSALLGLAREYGVGFIGLTLGEDGIPHDADERGLLAARLLAEAAKYGIDDGDVWLDPLALPVNTQQLQIKGCTEFVSMVSQISSDLKSTCGLSNVSNGAPAGLRGILNRTYLIMLKRYGIYSVIADAFDRELLAIASDERPEVEALVHRVMDGEEIEGATLSLQEIDYVKTARVLCQESVYSDLWLQA